MDELLVSEENIHEENMKIFEQIKALTKDKDKYTMLIPFANCLALNCFGIKSLFFFIVSMIKII